MKAGIDACCSGALCSAVMRMSQGSSSMTGIRISNSEVLLWLYLQCSYAAWKSLEFDFSFFQIRKDMEKINRRMEKYLYFQTLFPTVFFSFFLHLVLVSSQALGPSFLRPSFFLAFFLCPCFLPLCVSSFLHLSFHCFVLSVFFLPFLPCIFPFPFYPCVLSSFLHGVLPDISFFPSMCPFYLSIFVYFHSPFLVSLLPPILYLLVL
ncbi:hypothetical protein AMECASPLE_026722 [Ameca splendens]|uniref:Uncharacterized protein n=1 Tax=Ameca splendens TaxID=208324 RepID=A0ABV1A0I2_9TELE